MDPPPASLDTGSEEEEEDELGPGTSGEESTGAQRDLDQGDESSSSMKQPQQE